MTMTHLLIKVDGLALVDLEEAEVPAGVAHRQHRAVRPPRDRGHHGRRRRSTGRLNEL